eukprot:CAMPEP_0198126054 /NCGR_PEP_ID=MMETSP1442-20131203/43949_1 /TAXON_ID= /ORGANISM="Craspedostauros australis, Strain CCMP3328" /LENGTH=118 /DNA_ID=CAMNT_0043785765 /DNA_START=254 /DNA_END=606 /DNA_ORIENTATION=+
MTQTSCSLLRGRGPHWHGLVQELRMESQEIVHRIQLQQMREVGVVFIIAAAARCDLPVAILGFTVGIISFVRCQRRRFPPCVAYGRCQREWIQSRDGIARHEGIGVPPIQALQGAGRP